MIKNRIPMVRLTPQFRKEINSFLKYNPMTVSDLVRHAIKDYIHKDIMDRNLTSINLQKLTNRQEKVEDNISLMHELISYFMITWFAHTPEIPSEHKESAWLNGQNRFNKFFETLQTHIMKNDNLIQKLIMTNIEEKEPQNK